jgi:hypothetical protein
MTEPFNTLYQSGVDLMNEGRLTGDGGAIDFFDRAATNGDISEHVRALEMRGTCERMAGDFVAADNTFREVEAAMASTGAVGIVTPALQGRGTRDAAMVFIDIIDRQPNHPYFDAFVEQAHKKLLVSREVLTGANEATELAATNGYFARLELVSGHRRQARRDFRAADKALRRSDNRTYEANNGRWRMRAEPFWMRAVLFPRIRKRTLVDAKQSSRKKELWLLLLGNLPYTYAKRRLNWK